MNRRTIVLGLALAPMPARAHSFKQGDIAIGHAWALPATLGEGQVFVPLLNRGITPDALVAARSPVCRLIELRRNNRYDDPPEREFPLVPKMPLPMRPTARHLRLLGLRTPLKEGERIELVLDFQNAGEAVIHVQIETSASG
jgi:copper(I)-binding protein